MLAKFNRHAAVKDYTSLSVHIETEIRNVFILNNNVCINILFITVYFVSLNHCSKLHKNENATASMQHYLQLDN